MLKGISVITVCLLPFLRALVAVFLQNLPQTFLTEEIIGDMAVKNTIDMFSRFCPDITNLLHHVFVMLTLFMLVLQPNGHVHYNRDPGINDNDVEIEICPLDQLDGAAALDIPQSPTIPVKLKNLRLSCLFEGITPEVKDRMSQVFMGNLNTILPIPSRTFRIYVSSELSGRSGKKHWVNPVNYYECGLHAVYRYVHKIGTSLM